MTQGKFQWLSAVMVALSSRSHCYVLKPHECLWALHPWYIFLTHRICFIVSGEKFLWLNSANSSSVARGSFELTGACCNYLLQGRCWESRVIFVLGLQWLVLSGQSLRVVTGLLNIISSPGLTSLSRPSTASSWSKYIHITLPCQTGKIACSLSFNLKGKCHMSLHWLNRRCHSNPNGNSTKTSHLLTRVLFSQPHITWVSSSSEMSSTTGQYLGPPPQRLISSMSERQFCQCSVKS